MGSPTGAAVSQPFSLLGGPVQHTGGPPGLSTPREDADDPQEFMEQGAASSSRHVAGVTEFHRIHSGLDSETNDGVGQHVHREFLGDERHNLLLGRTGVRVEREARGSTRHGAEDLPQDRSRARDGRGRPSRTDSYHSATSAQNQELIMDLHDRSDNFNGTGICVDRPRMCRLPQPPWTPPEYLVRLDQ